MLLLGTLINACGIILGGILGLTKRQFRERTQVAFKGILGLLIIVVGLSTSWRGLASGSVGHFFQMLLIAIVAMMLGRLTGRLLHLQKGMNRLGQFAGKKVAEAGEGKKVSWGDSFSACAVLFCLPPIAALGAVLDGLNGYWQTLAVKAMMDGFTMMAFVSTFGWSAIAAVVPVVAFQGSITLGAKYLAPYLANHSMIDAVNATAGLLVFCVSLIVFEFRKVELADYLPSLAWAPLLAWVWK